MKKVNALKLRQSLGAVLRMLDKTGEPILVEKDRKPRAVLISLDDFNTRFVDRTADAKRRALVDAILRMRLQAEKSSEALVRDLRGPFI